MKLIAALVMVLALSACSLPVFFRVPIVQGNIVTADQVDKLKKGMTKKQVAYVLGTPLIKSPFESDRWDYVFYYRNPHAHVRQSKLDLYFVNDQLSDIEGGEEYTARAFGNDEGSNTAHNSLGPAAKAAAQANMTSQNNNPGNTGPSAASGRPGNAQRRPASDQSATGGAVPHRGPGRPGRPD